MRLYHLTDEQCRIAVIALMIAVPMVGFIALQTATLWGPIVAWSYIGVMTVLFGLIGFQVSRSRKTNSYNGQATDA